MVEIDIVPAESFQKIPTQKMAKKLYGELLNAAKWTEEGLSG
jgi:hypothetical protein